MKRWLIVIGSLSLMVCAAIYLFAFEPTTSGWYPVCALHESTGLLCPGCGTLRGLHQLLHGNFAAAWGFNPLMMLLLPVAAWLAMREGIWLLSGKRLPGMVTNPVCAWILVAVIFIFGIARNLPLQHS